MKITRRRYKTKNRIKPYLIKSYGTDNYYMMFNQDVSVYEANRLYKETKVIMGERLRFGLPSFATLKELEDNQIDELIETMTSIKRNIEEEKKTNGKNKK